LLSCRRKRRVIELEKNRIKEELERKIAEFSSGTGNYSVISSLFNGYFPCLSSLQKLE